MPEKITHLLSASNPKIATSAGGSIASALVTISENYGSVIDVVAGIVAIGAGILAMIWTILRMYDRWMERKHRK